MKGIYKSRGEQRWSEGRWIGVSTAAIAMACLAPPAWAQAADSADPSAATTPAGKKQPAAAQSDPSDAAAADIVVTGIRQSIQSAVATKRNAEQIVDSISAQDIGALP